MLCHFLSSTIHEHDPRAMSFVKFASSIYMLRRIDTDKALSIMGIHEKGFKMDDQQNEIGQQNELELNQAGQAATETKVLINRSRLLPRLMRCGGTVSAIGGLVMQIASLFSDSHKLQFGTNVAFGATAITLLAAGLTDKSGDGRRFTDMVLGVGWVGLFVGNISYDIRVKAVASGASAAAFTMAIMGASRVKSIAFRAANAIKRRAR